MSGASNEAGRVPVWLEAPDLVARVEDLTAAVRNLAILRVAECELPRMIDEAIAGVDTAAQALGLLAQDVSEALGWEDTPTEPTQTAGQAAPAQAGPGRPAEAEQPGSVDVPPPAAAPPAPPDPERRTEPDAPTEPNGPSTPTDGAEGTDAEPESHPVGEGPSAGPEPDYPEDPGFDESVVLSPPPAAPRRGGRQMSAPTLEILEVIERAAPASAIASEIAGITGQDVVDVRQTLKRLVFTGRVTRDDTGHVPAFTLAPAANGDAGRNGDGPTAATLAARQAEPAR